MLANSPRSAKSCTTAPASPASREPAERDLTLAGQGFIALNGGPRFSFSPVTSLFVTVAGQPELDALSADPAAERCGWLRDRFGVSWQVVPEPLGRMLRDAGPGRAGRDMQALMKWAGSTSRR